MSVHLFDCAIAQAPDEPRLLEEVTLRLIGTTERDRFDEELASPALAPEKRHSA